MSKIYEIIDGRGIERDLEGKGDFLREKRGMNQEEVENSIKNFFYPSALKDKTYSGRTIGPTQEFYTQDYRSIRAVEVDVSTLTFDGVDIVEVEESSYDEEQRMDIFFRKQYKKFHDLRKINTREVEVPKHIYIPELGLVFPSVAQAIMVCTLIHRGEKSSFLRYIPEVLNKPELAICGFHFYGGELREITNNI